MQCDRQLFERLRGEKREEREKGRETKSQGNNCACIFRCKKGCRNHHGYLRYLKKIRFAEMSSLLFREYKIASQKFTTWILSRKFSSNAVFDIVVEHNAICNTLLIRYSL